MKAPLAILSLALVGCVTVQPCVCPTAPKVEPPDGTGTSNLLPGWIKTTPSVQTLEVRQPWFDDCNWHYPTQSPRVWSTTLLNCDPPAPTPTPTVGPVERP